MTRIRSHHFKFLLLTFYFIETRTMMIRNDALISKMVSDFQKDNTLAIEPTYRPPDMDQQQQQPKNVLSLMQSVLCKNFPTIPCGMIVEDPTLKTLIERSIQQLKYKKLTMELQKTTTAPGYLTMFPIINSEDLSNFLQVSETGYYSNNNNGGEKVKDRKHSKKRHSKSGKEEKGSKPKNVDNTRSTVYGPHKNIRKFYPHKIKYKDKSGKAARDNYRDYSDEKLSMSVEDPEVSTRKKKMTENYNVEPENAPVWRIDYMKHGEPSLNMFSYEPDRLNEKLVKTNVGKNIMEQTPRKDVLHPDVYIKKNYVRRNGLEMNSGGID